MVRVLPATCARAPQSAHSACLVALLVCGCDSYPLQVDSRPEAPPDLEATNTEANPLEAAGRDDSTPIGDDIGDEDPEVDLVRLQEQELDENGTALGSALAPGLDVLPEAQAFLNLPETAEIAAAGWTTTVAFPGVTFDDPVFMAEAPGTGYLFVSEREGRMFAFENAEDVSEKKLVLDLRDVNQGENDSGILGFAFHPEFNQTDSENRSYIYLHYAFREDPIVGKVPDRFTVTYSRLARFSVDLDDLTIDRDSEVVLIDQLDESVWHQGGAVFFHPGDGFLYLSVGDEGWGSCLFENCQRIDKDLFGGVLRIDVDRRGGDVSYPPVRSPETGTTSDYFIPADNPFVGQGGLEEFYAIGLRSPHRMTHDEIDDVTFIGDVGQATREELNVLAKGANFQWNIREGTLKTGTELDGDPLGVWTDPLLEFGRDEARSITGGYVYRGELLPELRGKYIFADFSLGTIWALGYEKEDDEVIPKDLEVLVRSEFINRVNGITSFGVDAHGELYFMTLGAEAHIHRLTRQLASETNLPRYLSETGAFVSTEELEPTAGLLPYSVRSPLWSDGAHKQRWIALPSSGALEFSNWDPWKFPAGTVFVKHFELALDERQPDERRRLETRLLVAARNNEFFGVTYKWNDEGTDAELLFESQVEDISVIQEDGTMRSQRYFYPGPGDCLGCHNPGAGFVLGVSTRQLNGEVTYPQTGRRANQLLTWSALGAFEPTGPGRPLNDYPRLAGLLEEGRSVQDRVRSYWDSNCGMCHGVLEGIKADWDARYVTPLDEQGVIWAPLAAGGSDEFLVVPGDPESSVLFERDRTRDPERRMPPVGRDLTDEVYIDLLERWILGLDVE